MVEKLPVLKHHVDIIREERFGIKGKEFLGQEVDDFIKSLPINKYPLSIRGGLSKALMEASIAVVENNFKEVSDFKSLGRVNQNFDIICFNCSNYQKRKEVCRLREKDIEDARQKLLSVLKPKSFNDGNLRQTLLNALGSKNS